MCNIFLNKNSIERFKIVCSSDKYIFIENSNKLPPTIIEILNIIDIIINCRNLIREFWGEYFTIEDIIYTDEVIKKIDDFALQQLDLYKNIQIPIKSKDEIIEIIKLLNQLNQNNTDIIDNDKHYVITYNRLYENIFKMILALKHKDEFDNNPQAILKYFKAIKKEILSYRNILIKLLLNKLPKNYFYKKNVLEVVKKEFKNGN